MIYSAPNITRKRADEMVGNTDSEKSKDGAKRIRIEIPDRTFEYPRGSSLEYQTLDDDFRHGLIGRALNKLVYLDHMWRRESEMSYLRKKSQCARRYHMRYTK